MKLNPCYLKELSDLFVNDFNRTGQSAPLVLWQAGDATYPLLPGCSETELSKLTQAIHEKLYLKLPNSIADVLRLLNGFTENGVSLFGVDEHLRDEPSTPIPGFLEANVTLWAAVPHVSYKYFFIGESDLWHFAVEPPNRNPGCSPPDNTERSAPVFQPRRTRQRHAPTSVGQFRR